jgi:hypothetical protein
MRTGYWSDRAPAFWYGENSREVNYESKSYKFVGCDDDVTISSGAHNRSGSGGIDEEPAAPPVGSLFMYIRVAGIISEIFVMQDAAWDDPHLGIDSMSNIQGDYILELGPSALRTVDLGRAAGDKRRSEDSSLTFCFSRLGLHRKRSVGPIEEAVDISEVIDHLLLLFCNAQPSHVLR